MYEDIEKNTSDEFYEDWKKEVVAWNTGSSLDEKIERLEAGEDPEKIEKGTRASLGLDTSIEQFRYLQKIRLELIESGAIKDQCVSCKSLDTEFKDPIWTCNECKEKWHPLRLIYRGM